jgi:predicted HicB family RNase H-like nuclease
MSLSYKGYTAGPIELDDGVLSTVVVGLKDVIHCEGISADELVQAFRDSIDDYLALCAADGVEPERSYSGQILLRLDPELHRHIARAAGEQGVSLSQWIAQRLR